MKPPRLTDEQRAAAHRDRGDVCVLAGAGTGKTTVLTERFVHLVTAHGLSPRSIAALTYTDRAAAEMRGRIVERLGAFEDPARPDLASDAAAAPISTFHAYCGRILRENALAAGVDPAFEVLDETSSRLLLDASWDAVERRARREGDVRLRVLRRIGETDAPRTLLRAYARLRGLGADPSNAALARGPTSFSAALVAVSSALEAFVRAVADAALEGEEARDAARKLAALPNADALAGGGVVAARLLDRLRHEADRKVTLVFPGGVAVAEREALRGAYRVAGEAAVDEWAASRVEAPLRSLLAALDHEYESRKRERSALDFDDLERRALALLERLRDRGVDLPGRPTCLLIDEFQDVNPVQARLLSLLRRSARARGVDQFSVGDPKQSIYRFRRADVTVMQREWESVGAAGQAKLSASFRSRTEVVSFCNAAFDALFAGGAAGVDPEPLVATGAFDDMPVDPPELLVVDVGTGPGVDRRLAEARAVARRIRAWVDGGTLRSKRERSDDGAAPRPPRPLCFGDVAILLRARTHVKTYERALAEAGVPFHVGKGRGFYQAQEIADLLHLLRVVHNPLDAFAVAAWMASPAVGATDEDLFAACRSPTPFDAASRLPRVASAAERALSLRRLAAAGSLEAVVRAAVDGTDAIPTALLQPGGERRARNLEKAVAIARRLDDEGSHGLFDFLRALADLQSREIDEAESAVGGEEDSVALTTVHGAKGLEWPCVVLADASREDRNRSENFHVDSEGRVAWRLRDPLEGTFLRGGGFTALEEEANAADKRETLRLLYVALTRAEERLVVTASVKGAANAKKKPRPMRIAGWAKALWDLHDAPFSPGTHRTAVGTSALRVTVERPVGDPPPVATSVPWFRALGPTRVLESPVDSETAARAADLVSRVARRATMLAPHDRTPFVASVSDLLLFSRSPADYYAERIVGADEEAPARASVLAERDDPASGAEAAREDDAARAEREERRSRWDESRDVVGGVDRAALGRAVHWAIQRWSPASDVESLVRESVADEFGDDMPAVAVDLARQMVDRFLSSKTGRAVAVALAHGDDGHVVRREVAFHARIRFPDGEPVGEHEALLVKGAIDLWVAGGEPDREGRRAVHVFDHKTNAPSGTTGDPQALLRLYETQLRLYALAAERATERDVVGATLLLLDPGWGVRGVPVELAVDVSGERLVETRALCRAYARAMREHRFPARWEELRT